MLTDLVSLVRHALVPAFTLVPYQEELRERYQAWLKERGRPVEAKLTGIVRMQNGFQPWRITAEWHDPFHGRVVVLQSRNLYDDPTKHVEVGQTVKAWVDPDRPSRHWIDVSFLPGVGD
jgi:hypothetical protein